MIKNTSYYDREGRVYSSKRYPDKDFDYVHFFFKKRLRILLRMLLDTTEGGSDVSLLEIGCADGVVSRAIADEVPAVGEIVGIDTSEKMIDAAREADNSPRSTFFVRGSEDESKRYDIVVEVGVVNLTDRHAEYRYARDHLKDGGYYICSLASSTSLRSRLKQRDHKDGFSHLLSYAEYESELAAMFEIVDAKAYGLFIPFLWKIPLLARIIQPVESLVAGAFPGLFHEKIYLLRKSL
ncbi:MAG: class I SAM-dependent methyltransferase [Candidatus Paceibacterota bacterium]|jgi:2-polyprenyl-3-methyl-5-hydroxy-6-metoxy-1,4-benzoquinol methylase